jgi:hypothetical protein
MLKESGKSYLAFGSDPPTSATRGQTYRYTPVLWSNGNAAPTPTLEKRPDGMRLDGPDVVWAVPADAPAEVEVELRAENGSATSTQKYRVVVLDP